MVLIFNCNQQTYTAIVWEKLRGFEKNLYCSRSFLALLAAASRAWTRARRVAIRASRAASSAISFTSVKLLLQLCTKKNSKSLFEIVVDKILFNLFQYMSIAYKLWSCTPRKYLATRPNQNSHSSKCKMKISNNNEIVNLIHF